MPNRAAASQTSRLLSLPPEIRNIIYRKVLDDRHEQWCTKIPTKLPGLLQACKQIRFEASPLSFSETLFWLTLSDASFAFLHNLAQEHRRAIRALLVIGSLESLDEGMQALERAYDRIEEEGLHTDLRREVLRIDIVTEEMEWRLYEFDGESHATENLMGKVCECDHTVSYKFGQG